MHDVYRCGPRHCTDIGACLTSSPPKKAGIPAQGLVNTSLELAGRSKRQIQRTIPESISSPIAAMRIGPCHRRGHKWTEIVGTAKTLSCNFAVVKSARLVFKAAG